MHFILQVDKWRILKGKKMFSKSYYGFDNMICIRSTVEELNNLEQILPKMTEHAKADGYKVYGPLYYVFSKIPDDNIVYLKMPIQKS